MHQGYRFRLIREVDRFPDFVATVGRTGTITVIGEDVWAKIDQPIRGAGEWENEIHWPTLDEFTADTEPLK